MSSSASQNDYAAMSEDQLAEMLSKVKSLRQTEALRARLPAQLAPFASNISIIEPIQTAYTSLSNGVNCCSCQAKERRICMSVAVVPPPDSQSQEPHKKKPLKLVWRDWQTGARYISGSADSQMHSISLQYGHPHRRTHSKKPPTALRGWYEDPGTPLMSEFSHGGIKSVVEEVVRDMGFREGELDNNLVIDALLGDDGRQLLESHAEEGTTLRKVIEDGLDDGLSKYR